MTPAGFPHSDISGSKPVSGSPKLFAAYHVLHRLSLPRHPPYALSSLTIKKLLNQSIYYPCALHKITSNEMISCCAYYKSYMQLSKNIESQVKVKVEVRES